MGAMSDQNQNWNPAQGSQQPAQQPQNDPYAAPGQPPQPSYDPNQYPQQGYDPNQYVQPGYDPYAQQAQYQQGYAQEQQYGYGQQPGPQPGALQAKGSNFFKDLFDLSFQRFITPTVVSVVYLLSMIGIAIWMLVMIIAPFMMRSPGAGVLTLIIAPIGGLLALAFIRMVLESAVALIRVAENTKDIKDKQSS